LFTPAARISPQQFCAKVTTVQSAVDVHARSEGMRLPDASKHVAGVGHGANSQFGPVRETVVPSGQIFASAVQPTGPGDGGVGGAGVPPELPGVQARTVHMMPWAEHVQSLQPSGDLKLAPIG
jgi:hypothetical protein